jgi:SAM-dependent methyltransferase
MLQRDFTNKVNWILDNIIPPVIRDSRLLMWPLFWMLFKDKTHWFMQFKEKCCAFGPEEMTFYYKLLADVHLQRETDLNTLSLVRILDSVVGNKVLDIACGRGYVARRVHEKTGFDVTGIDINLPAELKEDSSVKFLEGCIEKINFPDKHFDTVICAHTLEHVRDLERAISELRRVTKRRLIVVVPRQREYKYTFDLHLHFFPYPYSLKNVMKTDSASVTVLGNDLFYVEDYP